jgi:hypothetical protein
MIGFSYIYKSSEEIFWNIPSISELWATDVLLFFWIVWGSILFTFILTPSIIILFEHIKNERAKKNKKKILTQILLQKEIEDEVEKEIQIEEENIDTSSSS